MSDLVTRLRGWRNWREVHIVRTHMLLEEAAAEIERLSRGGHCPDQDNGTNEDTVGRTLAQRITGLQPMLEYQEQIAILQSDNSRRADLEAGLREGVEKLQAEVRRLEELIAASQPTLTDEEREAVEAAARIIDGYDEEMDGFPSGAAATLRKLLERL